MFFVATTLKVLLTDEQPLPPPDEATEPEPDDDAVVGVTGTMTAGLITVVTTALPVSREQPLLPPDVLCDAELVAGLGLEDEPLEDEPVLQPLPPPEDEIEPPPWPSSSTEPEGSTAPFGPPWPWPGLDESTPSTLLPWPLLDEPPPLQPLPPPEVEWSLSSSSESLDEWWSLSSSSEWPEPPEVGVGVGAGVHGVLTELPDVEW